METPSDSRTPVHRRSLRNYLLATLGYILSPLSWWNDLVVNVPLAYAFAWPFAYIDGRLFLPMFVLGYWLSNLLGFILLHAGVAGIVSSRIDKPRKTNKSLRYNIAVSLLYSVAITLMVWLDWIPSPDKLINMIKSGH